MSFSARPSAPEHEVVQPQDGQQDALFETEVDLDDHADVVDRVGDLAGGRGFPSRDASATAPARTAGARESAHAARGCDAARFRRRHDAEGADHTRIRHWTFLPSPLLVAFPYRFGCEKFPRRAVVHAALTSSRAKCAGLARDRRLDARLWCFEVAIRRELFGVPPRVVAAFDDRSGAPRSPSDGGGSRKRPGSFLSKGSPGRAPPAGTLSASRHSTARGVEARGPSGACSRRSARLSTPTSRAWASMISELKTSAPSPSVPPLHEGRSSASSSTPVTT